MNVGEIDRDRRGVDVGGWRRGWRGGLRRRRGTAVRAPAVSVTLTSIGAPPRAVSSPFERDEAFVLEAEQIVSGRQVLECDASPFSGRLPLCRTLDRHLDAGDRLARWVADAYRKGHGSGSGGAAGRRGAGAGGCGAD